MGLVWPFSCFLLVEGGRCVFFWRGGVKKCCLVVAFEGLLRFSAFLREGKRLRWFGIFVGFV